MSIVMAASTLTGGASIPWYKAVAGVAGFAGTCATIYGGILLSQKTRLETRKLQLEITATAEAQAAGKPQDPAFTVPRVRTQSAIAISIEGYIIRFILLYLVFQIAGFLLSAVTPIISFSVYLVRDVGFLPGYIVGASVSYLSLAVNVVVFAALGLPLFKDILSSLGLRPRDIFSKRLRKEVIPQRERRRAAARRVPLP